MTSKPSDHSPAPDPSDHPSSDSAQKSDTSRSRAPVSNLGRQTHYSTKAQVSSPIDRSITGKSNPSRALPRLKKKKDREQNGRSGAGEKVPRSSVAGLVVTDLLKLRIALDQTTSLDGTCQVLAEQLCNLFDCSNAYVSIDQSGSLTIKGREDEASIELEDDLILSAQRDTAADNPMVGWPATDYWQTSLVHKNLSSDRFPSAISILMNDTSGNRVGVITVVSDKATCTVLSQKIKPVIDLVTPHIQLRKEASQSVRQRLSRSFKAKWLGMSKWVLIGCVLLAACFVPIPHQIQCDSEAKPIVRRFVSAPYESVLKSSAVRVGDSIQQGQTLARLDEEEMLLQMSSNEAEQEKYRKLKSAALAKGDTLAMQQAQLEYRRIAYRNDLLAQRSRNLEITSPISGVILSSELEDAEGAPLAQGQVLFEIAPLEKMIFCVYISQQDIALVEEGMQVKVTMDGAARTFRGTIKQIRPQAETFENESVFVADVEFDNEDAVVRPGMRGYATIVGRKQSIGWILFRKPYGYLKKLTGF